MKPRRSCLPWKKASLFFVVFCAVFFLLLVVAGVPALEPATCMPCPEGAVCMPCPSYPEQLRGISILSIFSGHAEPVWSWLYVGYGILSLIVAWFCVYFVCRKKS